MPETFEQFRTRRTEEIKKQRAKVSLKEIEEIVKEEWWRPKPSLNKATLDMQKATPPPKPKSTPSRRKRSVKNEEKNDVLKNEEISWLPTKLPTTCKNMSEVVKKCKNFTELSRMVVPKKDRF